MSLCYLIRVEKPTVTTEKPPYAQVVAAFDRACSLSQMSNAELGRQLPECAGRERPVLAETVRNWRKGEAQLPAWAMLGLLRLLTRRNWTLRQIVAIMDIDLKP
jgi:hypothetical protein